MRVDGRRMLGVTGAGEAETDITRGTIDVDPAGRNRRERAGPSPRREAELRSHESSPTILVLVLPCVPG